MYLRKLSSVAVAAAFASCQIGHAAVQEKPSTLADQKSVAVTIYNENLALIKDVRQVTLEAGANRLALREVSARMRQRLRCFAVFRTRDRSRSSSRTSTSTCLRRRS